ncbi:MAG: efflux RND transporter permease subunit, partial [Chthoniobacteraceae bacterium]
ARIGPQDERSIARFNGRPAVAIGVVKQSQAYTIEVARGNKSELERMQKTLPEGVNTAMAYDESEYVAKAVAEVWETLAIAFGLVIIVIYVFLKNFRSTLIPAVAIPVSIVGTFAALYFLGYSVNILTMLALVLSIGIVVDDAIVVLENIYRHIENGLSPLEASKKAMDEIAFAILAITFSLVAVFLPLAFQTSTTGRLFVEFAVTVAVSVVISAFVALTLTPMMGARILRPIHEQKVNRVVGFLDRGLTRIDRWYDRALRWSLAHRVAIVFIGLLSLGATVFFFGQPEKEFLPEEDKGRLFNVVVAPEGATSEYTDRQMRKMEAIVESYPEVTDYFDAVALSRGGPGDPSSGLMFLKLKDGDRRSVQDVVGGPVGMQARFFGEIEGALAFPIVPKAIGRGFGQTFQLVLQNQDLAALSKYAGDLANKLRNEGYLLNVRSVFQLDKPQLDISIDRNRAAALGVSIEEISRTLQILFGGLDLSKVKREGKEYDVIVQLARTSRLNPRDLDSVYVRSSTGGLVQLTNVVQWKTIAGPSAINHYNRLRSASIEATPVGVPLGTAVERVEALLAEDLPAGFRYEWNGEAKDLKESGGEIYFVLLLAIVIIYMVLAAQFESLIHPLTVMLALPLAAVGALGALWLLGWVNEAGVALHGWTNYAPSSPDWAKTATKFVPRIPAMNINLFSQIGLVLLLGLVTKNSILLVEFANQAMEQGRNARDAMLEAGATRLRPILMTSFSTIAGIMPIAIGFGAGAESRRPMGVAVVGGMLTSTFLTLLIIPVIYTLFADLAARATRKKATSASRREAKALEDAEAG